MESAIILTFLLGIASGFEIYWNVPTTQCRNYNLGFEQLLKTYGLKVNDDAAISGKSVTIFYDTQLGFYPKINYETGEQFHGGIPQRADLEKHLTQARTDLVNKIPWEKFNGLGVIDWESWIPVWANNFGKKRIYQSESKLFAKESNPKANSSEIDRIAKSQFTDSAKEFTLKTLRMAKKLRPDARWCFYEYPECYNHNGKAPKDFPCLASAKEGNDELSWLWKESTAVCPYMYVFPEHFGEYTFEERTWKDNEKLRETLRVADRSAKIYPYINYYAKKLLPKEEIWRLVAQPAASGSDGAVIWGASESVASEQHCRDLKQYIIDILGPAAEKVAYRSDLCSEQVCNGQGRCTFPGDDYANAWKLFTDDKGSFYAGDITCRCNENYSGRYCQQKK